MNDPTPIFQTIKTGALAVGGTVGALLAYRGLRALYDDVTARYWDWQHRQATLDHVQTQNALGQSSTMSYDYDLGLPLSLTGPNGANTTVTVEYDAFGRLVKLIRPGDDSANPTLQASYHDFAPLFYVELSGKIDSETSTNIRRVFNGLGQLIQTQTLSSCSFRNESTSGFSYLLFKQIR